MINSHNTPNRFYIHSNEYIIRNREKIAEEVLAAMEAPVEDEEE